MDEAWLGSCDQSQTTTVLNTAQRIEEKVDCFRSTIGHARVHGHHFVALAKGVSKALGVQMKKVGGERVWIMSK